MNSDVNLSDVLEICMGEVCHHKSMAFNLYLPMYKDRNDGFRQEGCTMSKKEGGTEKVTRIKYFF